MKARNAVPQRISACRGSPDDGRRFGSGKPRPFHDDWVEAISAVPRPIWRERQVTHGAATKRQRFDPSRAKREENAPLRAPLPGGATRVGIGSTEADVPA